MKKWHLIPCLLALMLLVISCAPTAPPLQLTEQQKAEAAQVIMDESGVIDAAIIQEGENLSLAIVVEFDTPEIRAKFLAEKFINMVMKYGPENQFEWEKGIYDYLVTIVNPNEQIIVQGYKANHRDYITW